MIAVVQGASGGELILVGLFALPPILAAATTSPRATGLIAGYCFVLAVFALFWIDFNDAHVVRLVIVGLAGYLSFWSASRRWQVTAEARGGAVLAEGFNLINTLDERDIVKQLAEVAIPELGDIAVVDVVDEDGNSISSVAISATDPGIARKITEARDGVRINPNSAHPVAEVIRSGEQRVLSQMADGDMREIAINEEHLETVREVRPRSMLIAPLMVLDERFGALILESLDDDQRYGSDEREFAQELASRAAVAMMNARRHDEEARLARALQQSLLPPALPQIPGLEVAARFRPLGLGTEIGGDFFDLFQLGRSSWAAVIGDVCGKGPEAAALTSLMRDTLRSSVLRGESPKETLELLNAAILEAAGTDGRFCTSAYARFDLVGPDRLTVCNGGHPPPLVLRKDGRVESIGPPGTLLGIYEDPRLSNTSVTLKEGDLVMLYTDGLFEVKGDGNGGPIEPVEEMLARCAGQGAESTAEAIEQRALQAHGHQPQDDMAILVLKRV